jgi:2-polyprenyl-3-methyl-5-hydroxy-6-metoxy-1,4-benzoquinol methylase
MKNQGYKAPDFEHPSLLFVFEDWLKGWLGGALLYDSYYRSFGLEGGENVLDFGCGGGAGSRRIARLLGKGGRVTCIDLSDYWIARARKRLARYPAAECRAGDIRQMDTSAAPFDVITTFHVIHDIAPAQRQETVRALAGRLMPGGRFFIREPVKESHGMPVEEIRSLMKSAGMEETVGRVTKSEYLGEYRKPPQ